MKKGFTLIELLGVIVILSLLMLLVFPNVLSVIKKSNNDKDAYTLKMIMNAADIYIKENPDAAVENSSYCIPLDILVDEGNLKGPIYIEDNNVDLTHTKSILMPYDENNLKDYIVDNGDNRCWTNNN